MRKLIPLVVACLVACNARQSPEQEVAGVEAFAVVQQVLQHPRCLNCHIPGDRPLQFDEGIPHSMDVVRGPDGHGAPGLACSSCHADRNPPASHGPHAPPGAPHWGLPPPESKMAWVGLSPLQLCETLKDRRLNGGRDLAGLREHIAQDALVLWGWAPGGARAPVPVPHAEFVAAFDAWVESGGSCPA